MKQNNITIFGGTGFLGSYICKELAKTGAAIKIVSRNPDSLEFDAKVTGSVGQIFLVSGNIRDTDSLRKQIKNSNIVINATGILAENRIQKFSNIHAQAAEQIAKISKEENVRKLIHISALVNANTDSNYAKTKLIGEKAVLAAFPKANIIRPSVVFGQEDLFFNKFASILAISPCFPLFGCGSNRFQPVYVNDVAVAIRKIVENDDFTGKIFEFGGPKTYSFKEILEFICHSIKKKRFLIPTPYTIGSIIGFFAELLPDPVLTRDQITMLKEDNIIDYQKKDILYFEDLKILPKTIEAIVPQYLAKYIDK